MKLNPVFFKSIAIVLSLNLIFTWPGPVFTEVGYAADLQEQKQTTTVPTTSLVQLQSSQKKTSSTNTASASSSSMFLSSTDFLSRSAPISRVTSKQQALIAPAIAQKIYAASMPTSKSSVKTNLTTSTNTLVEETDARKLELLKRVDETTSQTDAEINKLKLEQEKAIALFNEWAKNYNVSVSSLDEGMKTMSESLEKLLTDPSLPEAVLSGIRDLSVKVRDLTSPENVNNFQQLSALYYDYEKEMKTVVPFYKLSSLQAFRKELDDYRADVLAAQTLEELAALAAKFPPIPQVYPAPLLRREDLRPLASDLIRQGTILISDAKSYQNAMAAVKAELINHFGVSQADMEKVIVKVDLKTLEAYAAIDSSVVLPHRPDQVMMPNVLGVSELPSEISFKLQVLPGLQPAVLCMADSYCQSWSNDYHLESAKFVLRDQTFELAYGLPMYVSKDPSLPVAVQFGTPNVLNGVKIADKTGVRVREINFFRFMDSKDLEARITDFAPSFSGSRKRIVTMGDMGDGRLSIRRVAEYRTDNAGNNVLSVNNEFEYISTKSIPPVVRFRSIKRTDINGILLSTITPVEIVTATQITDPLNGSVTTVMPNDRFVADIALPGGAVARVAFASLWELMDLAQRIEATPSVPVYKLSQYNMQDPSVEMFRITVLANNNVEVLWRWNSADLPLTILGNLDPSSGMITMNTSPVDPANATQAVKTNNEMVRNYYGNQVWKIQMVPYPDSDFKAGYIHMASLERSLRDASKPFSTDDDMTYHKATYKWNALLGRDAIDTVEKKFENFRQFAQFKVAARLNSATGQTFYREEQAWMDFFVKGASGVEERTLRRTFYAKTNDYNSELLHINYLLSGDLKNFTPPQLAAIDFNNNTNAVKIAQQEAAAPLWYSIDYGPIYRWNDWQKDASGVIGRNPKSHNDYLGFGLNFTNWKYLGRDSQGKEIWDQDDVEVINYPAQNYVYLSQRAMNGGYEDYRKYMISNVNGNITLAEAAYAWKIQTTTESHGHFKNLIVAMGADGIPELRYSGDFSYGDVNGAGQNVDRMRPLKGVNWDVMSKTMSWVSADESLVIAVTLDSALTQVTKVLLTEKDADGNFGKTEYFYDTLVKRSWIDNPSNIPGWGTMLQLPTRRIYQWKKNGSLNSYDLMDAEHFVFDGSGNYRDRFRIEDDRRGESRNTIASYEKNDSNIRNIYYTNNLNGSEYSGIGAKSIAMSLLNLNAPVTDVSGMQTAMRTLAVYRNVERVSATWDNFTYSVQSTKKAGEAESAYIARLIKVYKNLGGGWNGNQYDSYIINSNFNQALLNTVYTQSAIAAFVINQAAAGTLTKFNQSFYAYEGNTPNFQNSLMQGINPPFMAHFGYGESLNHFKSQNYRGQPSEDARYQGYYGLRLQRQFALVVADSDQPTQVFTESVVLDYPNETMTVINDKLYSIEIINGNVFARDMQAVITELVNLFGLSASDVMKALKQGTIKGKVDRLTSKLTLTMGPGLSFAKSIDEPYLLNLVDQVSLPSAINFQLAFYEDQFAIVSGDFSLADRATPFRQLNYRFSYTNNALSNVDVYDGQNLIKQIMNISKNVILVSDPVNSIVQEITIAQLADGKRHIVSIVKKQKEEEGGCGGILAPVQSTQVFNYGCPPGTNCLIPTTLIGIDSYNGAISISEGAIKLPAGVNKTWTVNHFGAAADALQADLKLAAVEGVFRIAFKTLPDLLAQVEKYATDLTNLTQQEKDWLAYTKITQNVSPAAPIKIVMQSVINSLTALQRDFYIHEYQLKQWASEGKISVEFINNGGAYTVALNFKTSPPRDQDVWPLWAVKLDAFNNKFKIPESIIFKVDNISLAVGGIDFFQAYKSTDPAASVKSFSASYNGGALTALQKFKAFFVGGITVASSNPVWESIAIPGNLNDGVYLYCYDTSCNGSIPPSGSAHPYAAVYKSLTVTYESTYTFKTITEARRDGMTISNSFVNNETIMGDVYSQVTRSTGTSVSQTYDEDMVSGNWRSAVDVVVGNATYRMFYDGSVYEMLQKARSVELNPTGFSDEENEWRGKIPTAQTKAAIQAVLQAVNALERDFSFSKYEMKRWLWQGKVSITYDSTNSKVNFAFADSLKGTYRNLYERVILNPFSNAFEIPDSISVLIGSVSKAVTQLTLLDAAPSQTGFNKVDVFYKAGALQKLEEYKVNADGSYPAAPYQIVEILNNTDRYNSVYRFTNTDPNDPVAVREVKFQWGTYVKEITETYRDGRVIRTVGELNSTIMGETYYTTIKRYDLTLNPSTTVLPPPISELTVKTWLDYYTVSYNVTVGGFTGSLNFTEGRMREFLSDLNKLEREKYGVNAAFADLVSSFGVSSAAVTSGKIKFAIDAASRKLIMLVDPSVTLSAAPDQPFLATLLGFSAMPARIEFSLQQTSAGFELSTAAFSVGGLTYNLTYSNRQLSQVDVYSGSALVKQVTNYSTNLITVYTPALNEYADYTIVTWADGSRHITNVVSRPAVILKWGGCDGD